MASYMLSFFPRDVLDEIWDLIASVSECFPTYSFIAYVPKTPFLFVTKLNSILVEIS